MDATGSYKTDDSYDYVCKMKLIDESHNPLNNEGEKLPFVQIFIFTSKLSESPVVRRVGDIVLLKNFSFDTYKNMVKGIFKKSRSEWFLFGGGVGDKLKPKCGSKEHCPALT